MTPSQENANIDQVLRTYFRREMPARFPAAPGTSSPARFGSGATTLTASRLIVGASLVAMMLAYMGLSAYFPTQSSSGVNPNSGSQIGSRPGLSKTVTPER